MDLYLYCSSGTLLEYFTLNRIVCNDYLSMKNRKVIPSLGLVSSKFIFLTTKKLMKTKRLLGFDQDYMEMPAALELSVSEHDAAYWPVLFVDAKGVVSDSFHPLSDLSEQSIGVFVEAEISFSFVSRVLFDHENAADDIYRPSLDLYFPEHLYGITDSSFSDELNTDVILEAAGYLDRKYADLDVCSLILKRTKAISIALNAILETKAWPFGERHTANFDAITIDLLGLSDEMNRLTSNEEERIKDAESDFILRQIKVDEVTNPYAAFFQEFVKELICLSSEAFSRSDFQDVMEKVIGNVCGIYSKPDLLTTEKTIERIEELVYGSSQKSLEVTLEDMDDSLGVLKAMIFFLRSTNSSGKLEDGLAAYHVKPDIRRYAWIMFSALNGIEPVPAEKKGNRFVMNAAETVAMQRFPDDNIVSIISSTAVIEKKFVPVIEEKLSADCVQAFLVSEASSQYLQDLIKRFAKNRALSKGFNEKKYTLFNTTYNSLFNTTCNLFNILNEKYPPEAKVSQFELDRLMTDLQNHVKKSKAEYDIKRFVSDYIEDTKRFLALYQRDEAFWKEAYQRGKKV